MHWLHVDCGRNILIVLKSYNIQWIYLRVLSVTTQKKKIGSTSGKKHSDIGRVCFVLSHVAGLLFLGLLFCLWFLFPCFFPVGFVLALTKLKCTDLLEGWLSPVGSSLSSVGSHPPRQQRVTSRNGSELLCFRCGKWKSLLDQCPVITSRG